MCFKKKQQRLWFYTAQKDLSYLLATGMIMPTTKSVCESEKPTVWLSVNPVWDESANRTCRGNDGHLSLGDKKSTYLQYGLLRIEVEPDLAPYHWREYVSLSGIDKREVKVLQRTARAHGAKSREWRMTFAAIAAEQWLSIETWDWDTQSWKQHVV